MVSVRLTPSLSRRALGGPATCGRAYFMTSLPIAVRPEPAALPFHEYPGPAQDRKQTETSWVRVIATQNSTGKLKAFWTYFKEQNNKEYQLAAWPVWRPESRLQARDVQKLWPGPFAEAQVLAVPSLVFSGHKPQGELREAGFRSCPPIPSWPRDKAQGGYVTGLKTYSLTLAEPGIQDSWKLTRS